jgi:rhodanese-related sulfurtransferase
VSGLALALLVVWRTGRLTRDVKQLKRDLYYADGRLKRVPEDIREAVEPLRMQLANVATGGRVPKQMILDGRLYMDVTADEAHRALTESEGHGGDKVMVVDVRTSREYAARRLPGAKLVPFDELPNRYKAEIPETTEKVFLYCMGGERSRSACDFLSRQGYTNLYNIKDGLQGWRGPIEGEGEVKMVQFGPSGGGRAS